MVKWNLRVVLTGFSLIAETIEHDFTFTTHFYLLFWEFLFGFINHFIYWFCRTHFLRFLSRVLKFSILPNMCKFDAEVTKDLATSNLREWDVLTYRSDECHPWWWDRYGDRSNFRMARARNREMGMPVVSWLSPFFVFILGSHPKWCAPHSQSGISLFS